MLRLCEVGFCSYICASFELQLSGGLHSVLFPQKILPKLEQKDVQLLELKDLLCSLEIFPRAFASFKQNLKNRL